MSTLFELLSPLLIFGPARDSLFLGATLPDLIVFCGALEDLLDHLDVKPGVYPLLVMLMQRCAHLVEFTVYTTPRLLLGLTVIAIKMQSDEGISNRKFARLIGLHARDISSLERMILYLLEYRIIEFDVPPPLDLLLGPIELD